MSISHQIHIRSFNNALRNNGRNKGGIQILVCSFLVYEYLECDFLVYGEKGKSEFVLPSHMYVSWVEGGAYLVSKRDVYK